MGDPNERKDRKEAPKRIVSSFSQIQLREVYDWFRDIDSSREDLDVPDEEVFSAALDTIDDPTRKRRFGFGLTALRRLDDQRRNIDEVTEVLVWQRGEEEAVEIEFKFLRRPLDAESGSFVYREPGQPGRSIR